MTKETAPASTPSTPKKEPFYPDALFLCELTSRIASGYVALSYDQRPKFKSGQEIASASYTIAKSICALVAEDFK